jgi:hypothetical protein
LVGLVFSYPLFVGQLGLEFWLFNAALLTSAGATASEGRESRLEQSGVRAKANPVRRS